MQSQWWAFSFLGTPIDLLSIGDTSYHKSNFEEISFRTTIERGRTTSIVGVLGLSASIELEPTTAVPGSAAKLEVLRQRAEAGHDLWHEDDCHVIGRPSTGRQVRIRAYFAQVMAAANKAVEERRNR